MAVRLLEQWGALLSVYKEAKRFVDDFDKLVRRVVNEIGFDDGSKGFDGHTCGVLAAIAATIFSVPLP